MKQPTQKNFKKKFQKAGEKLKKHIGKLPKLKKSWGVYRFIPQFIYDFDELKRKIDGSPRESVIDGEYLLKGIQDKALEEIDEIVTDYISFIERFIEEKNVETEGEITDEDIQQDIELYYELLVNGNCLTTNVLLIYDEFIENKCYAFQYDW